MAPHRRLQRGEGVFVRCERCDTRFKLDESRLPARGARVRCSRCKHAFFVLPPGAKREDQVHSVAEEAARGRTRSPGPTWDLDEGGGTTRSPARVHRPEPTPPEREEEDSDWRFEDEVPSFDATDTGLDLSGERGAPDLEADPNESSFAGLGDPESWDLGSSPPAPAAKPAAAGSEAPAPRPAVAPMIEERRLEASARKPAEAREPEPVPASPLAIPRSPAGPTEWAGWAATLALALLTTWGAFRPPRVDAGAAAFAPVAGFEIVEARGRLLENAIAGPILVVSGRLRNPGPTGRALAAPVEVRLLDADGELLPEVAAVGPALPAARLREEDPESLRAEQGGRAGSLARMQLAPGAELAFDAVFESAPAQAARFVVQSTR